MFHDPDRNAPARADSAFARILRGLVGGVVFFVALSARAQIPVPDILWYRFNEPGATLTNYASSPPAGTATATIMGSSFTQNNSFSATAQSLAGNGTTASTDYVNTNWATNLPGSWTLSFFTSNIVPSTTLWYILGDTTAGNFRCFTNGVAGPNNWILRGPIADVLVVGAADSNPHMVTFVYDQPNNQIRAYKDAVLVNTVAQSAFTLSGSGPFKVGGYSSNATLNGNMADFRLYSYALSDTDISNIYDYVFYSYYIGGTVSGLARAGLVLQNNGGDDLPVAADGSFQFATPILDGTGYDVSVSAQPGGQQCTVNSGSGNVASANVTDVSVTCTDTPTDLVLTVDDGSNYAQYGQSINYLVTLTNIGGTTASNVAVSSAVSGLGQAQWQCTPSGGATCTASGSGVFGDTVSIPFSGALNWVVTIPVYIPSNSNMVINAVEFDVSATGATAAGDVDTLVIFRDGFGN